MRRWCRRCREIDRLQQDAGRHRATRRRLHPALRRRRRGRGRRGDRRRRRAFRRCAKFCWARKSRASPAASPTAPSSRRHLMGGYLVETCTKWWGPDRHIVIYPVSPNRDETYFVTSVPDPDWDVESWSARGRHGRSARRVRRFPRQCPARAGQLPARTQMGAVRARSAGRVGPTARSPFSATPATR